jgi:hypothetical protein
MSDSTNAVATISNQSRYDLTIYDVFNSTGDPHGVLTYTNLGEIKAGQKADIQTLHSASQLQAKYTGNVADLDNTAYCQFPVAVMAVSKIFASLSFTVTDDDMKAMVQAFKFIQFTSANAESKITKDFTAALSNTDNQTGAVNTFFAGSASFNKVKMKNWTAMVAWQTQFLSPWKGTYYLYNNPKDANSTVSLIAVLSIDSATNQGTVAVADGSGNVSPSSQSAQLAAAGDGTMSETEGGTGGIDVSLQPVWMSLTQKAADGSITYAIGSAVAGTFNGTAVTGTQQKQDVSSGGGTSGGGQSSNLGFSQLTTIIGLLIGAATLWVMYKQGQAGHTQARNNVENKAVKDGKPDQSEIEKEQKTVDDAYKVEVQNQNQSEQVTKAKENAGKVGEAKQALSKAQQQKDSAAELEKEENIAEQETENELELGAPDATFESIVTELLDAQGLTTSGDLDGAKAKLESIQSKNADYLKKNADKMPKAQKEAREKIQESVEKNLKDIEDGKERDAKQQEDDNNDVEEPVEVDETPKVEA